MASIPRTLEDWNLEVVFELVSKGFVETDTFDFKEVLRASGDTGGYRKRLASTACAFANTVGGFVVIGVRDAGNLASVEDRIVGIPKSPELAKHFGDQMSNIEPTLDFTPQNPPIEVPGTENVIFVVYIPPGKRGPHMTGDRAFYKRTNGGNELMTYSEIDTAFTRYEERIAKVKLLFLTLIDLWIRAQQTLRYHDDTAQYCLVIPDAQTIMPILSDTYGLLSSLENLTGLLMEIRQLADVVTTRIRLFHQQIIIPITGRSARVIDHNIAVADQAKELQNLIDRALDTLGEAFGFSREKREEGDLLTFHLEGID